MAVAARSAGIQSHALGRHEGTLIERSVAARQAGLRGALCFDSSDVASINAGFSPPHQEIQAAQQVLDAMKAAVDGGRGAVATNNALVRISREQEGSVIHTLALEEELVITHRVVKP